MLLATLALFFAAPQAPGADNEKLHFSYHWHLEQPIYWPDQQQSGNDRNERAWESILRTDQGDPHPANDLRAIFGKADRVAVYQWRVKDSISAISWADEAGAQVSYSGGLVENMQSLGGAGQLGYSSWWNSDLSTARTWPTVGRGVPRCEVVQFPFHHPLLPLLDDSAVRKELQLYREVYDDTWGTTPGPSRGLFPPEMAFSMRLIPALADEGIDWCFVSGEKLSRACADFPVTLGSGGVNCDPPNPADQLNPAAGDYYRKSISRGCAPAEAYPFAFTPHRAQYIDPNTGAASSIIVVPCAQALGWDDGYAPQSLSSLDALQAKNDPQRPMLVVVAHDGDNAWGGGYDYYMNAVPNFVGQAQSAGYHATVVEEYLRDHPVPIDDYVHVEDGAWVNADGDFGAPQFLNWNWPPVDGSGHIDIAGGWAEDVRNWAVITAAQNVVDTAEQIHKQGGGPVRMNKILYPDGSTNAVERAWHYFLGALNSGYMYYGTALDMEVKQTIACNEAIDHASIAIGSGANDATPPTVWIPQRFPWNPGGLNYGPQFGYQEFRDDGDFTVWTFVHDIAGVQSVTLMVRADLDGVNAASDADNETYAGGAGVGAWQPLPMARRAFPAGNFHNDPAIDFFEMPQAIADQYYAEVVGVRDTLLDYYIEATDSKGNLSRSPIQHVWVGDGSGSGGTSVTVSPDPPVAGQVVTVTYDPTNGPLAQSGQVLVHAGINGWNPVAPSDRPMAFHAGSGTWSVSGRIPTTANQLDLVFRDSAGNWDNNNGQDWHFPVSSGGPGGSWSMDGTLDADAQLVATNNGVNLWAGVKGSVLYLATEAAANGYDRFILTARQPGSMVPAMWAKSGMVAQWDAYLGNESDSGWSGWTDATPSASSAAGSVLEGTLDLAREYGTPPNSIYVAVGLYGTVNGAPLEYTRQIGPSVNSDINLDASEYLRLP